MPQFVDEDNHPYDDKKRNNLYEKFHLSTLLHFFNHSVRGLPCPGVNVHDVLDRLQTMRRAHVQHAGYDTGYIRKFYHALDELFHTNLVGRVHGARRALSLRHGPVRESEARKPFRVRLEKLEPLAVESKLLRHRGNPLRKPEGVGYRDFHVRRTHLGNYAPVYVLDHGMDDVGWLRASPGVTPRSSLKGVLRKGPPEAVSIILFTSSFLWPSRD